MTTWNKLWNMTMWKLRIEAVECDNIEEASEYDEK